MALAAVTIGLPAPAPLWLYMAAIERGLHVLREKPLAMTSAEARRLTDAAEAAGLVTMCPFTYRFMPVSRWRKELVDEGYLGRPSHLSLRYFAGYRRGDEYMWRFDLGEAGGGIGRDRGLWAGARTRAAAGRRVLRCRRGLGDDPPSVPMRRDRLAPRIGRGLRAVAVWPAPPDGLHGSKGTLHAICHRDRVQRVDGCRPDEPRW
jgi:hypothetical protein